MYHVGFACFLHLVSINWQEWLLNGYHFFAAALCSTFHFYHGLKKAGKEAGLLEEDSEEGRRNDVIFPSVGDGDGRQP